jgi:hypothetical protein
LASSITALPLTKRSPPRFNTPGHTTITMHDAPIPQSSSSQNPISRQLKPPVDIEMSRPNSILSGRNVDQEVRLRRDKECATSCIDCIGTTAAVAFWCWLMS